VLTAGRDPTCFPTSEIAHTPRRVLVVEDEPDGRQMLRALLAMWGYRVAVAADGLEGVEKALAWRPEAAVIDIGLPSLEGCQVAQRIRAALGPQVLLIALTAYGHERERALEYGFNVFMTKPADTDELKRLLRERVR
jgi:CheY-like chemotaxis protein